MHVATYRSRPVLLVIVAAAVCAVSSSAAATPIATAWCAGNSNTAFHATKSPVRLAAPVRTPQGANLAFGLSMTPDGSIQVDGRAGDLIIRKTVAQNGEFTLELDAGDRVVVAFTAHAIRVTRGRKTIVLTPEARRDDDFQRAHVLLAESRAVRLFRTTAAAIQHSEDDSAPAAAMVMADALVGTLTGDVGATVRAARHLSRHARPRFRTVALAANCYGTWEQQVVGAADELDACVRDVGYWSLWTVVCSLRWHLAVESYWVSFLTCSGFGSW